MTKERSAFRSLLTIIFIDQSYITFTFPLITLLFFDNQSRLFSSETSYAVRSLWYGLCVGLPNFLNIFFTPILSALSDEFGRKKILLLEIASAFIFAFVVGIGIFFGKLWILFIGFAIKGVFSKVNPTALAMVGDTSNKSTIVSKMGYLQFAISVGAAIGPILGGYLAKQFYFATLNFATPFFIVSFCAFINTLLALYLIRETHKHPANKWQNFSIGAFRSLLFRHEIFGIAFTLLLIQCTWSSYYLFMPPLLKTNFDYNAQQLGLFLGMIALCLALTTGIGIQLLQRYFRIQQLLMIAVYLIITGTFFTIVAAAHFIPHAEFFIWISALPVAGGDVIAYSCLIALFSQAVAQEQQGKVMGIALFIVASTWACTSFIGGLLLSFSPLFPLLFASVGVIVAIFLISSSYGIRLTAHFEMSC